MAFFDVLFFVLLFVSVVFFFFFNDTATTEIYTLSLHDALPILFGVLPALGGGLRWGVAGLAALILVLDGLDGQDRKSTRLNSSHGYISYAVFCLKKKKKTKIKTQKKTYKNIKTVIFG